MNFGPIDSVIFFGGGETLRCLLARDIPWKKNLFVVTSARHALEKGFEDETTFEVFLRSHGVQFVIVDSMDDPDLRLQIGQNTLGVSVSAAWIFKKDFINRFNGKFVNLHGAPLPRFGGGGAFSWPILQGETRSGNTIHLMTPGIDTGPIVVSDSYEFPKNCRTPLDYERYAADMRTSLLEKFFAAIKSGEDFLLTDQDATKSTYWPRLATDKHGFIDWSWSNIDIAKFVRAFDDPYPGARTYLGEIDVRLKDCDAEAADERFHPFQAGIVYRRTDEQLFIAAREGALRVRKVTDGSGKDLLPSVRLGDRFFTPSEDLDESMRYRAIYTPKGLKDS